MVAVTVLGIQLLLLIPFLPIAESPNAGSGLGWATAAGVFTLAGAVLTARALMRSPVGQVAALVSCEGVVVVLLAGVTGESLDHLFLASLPLVLGGGVAVALASPSGPAEGRAGLVMAVAAACFFGVALWAVSEASKESSPIWALLPGRLIPATIVVAALCIGWRPRFSGRLTPWLLAAGVADLCGFLVYAIGSTHSVAVTALIAAQFPVAAALLARVVFDERLTGRQLLGVVIVGVGVALIALSEP